MILMAVTIVCLCIQLTLLCLGIKNRFPDGFIVGLIVLIVFTVGCTYHLNKGYLLF